MFKVTCNPGIILYICSFFQVNPGLVYSNWAFNLTQPSWLDFSLGHDVPDLMAGLLTSGVNCLYQYIDLYLLTICVQGSTVKDNWQLVYSTCTCNVVFYLRSLEHTVKILIVNHLNTSTLQLF